MMFRKTVISWSVASALVVMASNAVAGGFGLIEQSGSGLGNAFAGGAASAEDASTIYYNPAGLSRVKGTQVAVAMHAIRPSAKFTGTGIPPAVNMGGDPGSWGYVPNGYFSMGISPSLTVGLGLNAPFGLQTQYDAGWVGRNHGIKSQIETINLNPSLAYKVSDTFSVGAGISYQHIRGGLSGFAGAAGSSQLSGSDNAWGYNFGALFNVTPQTRVGLAYRSQIKYTLKGEVAFSAIPALNGPVSLAISMPDNFSASVFHQLNDRWDLMADATWTGWSVLKELRVLRANGALLSLTPENWRDTWRLSAGANYHYNDQWMTRVGVAFDQTPVADMYRTVRIPDQSRTWLSIGGQYKPGKDSAIDIGYAYLFMKDATINSALAQPLVAFPIRGTYTSISTNILSAQYTNSF